MLFTAKPFPIKALQHKATALLRIAIPFSFLCFAHYALALLSTQNLAEQCHHPSPQYYAIAIPISAKPLPNFTVLFYRITISSPCFTNHSYANPLPCSPLPIQNSSHLSNSNSVHS
jgi:hypothetical protein